MLRNLILGITNRAFVRRLATGRAGRRVARRFVAGEDIEDALKVVKILNERGMTASLDYLGENVRDASAAQAAADVYRSAIERIEAAGLQANLSVKLTQMGLDLDPEVALGNAAVVAARAAEAGTTLTLDMEDHRYTDLTVDTCLRLAHPYPGHIGVAVQAYLYRTPADVERLIEGRVQVRLCKGAYREPRKIAYRHKAEVDRAYATLLVRLLEAGAYPMIATHDARLVSVTPGRRSSSRCSMASAVISRSSSSATATRSASTCRSAASGIRTSCVASPSARRTSSSSSASSSGGSQRAGLRAFQMHVPGITFVRCQRYCGQSQCVPPFAVCGSTRSSSTIPARANERTQSP